ncbi:MAG: PAS domain S-box protein [Nitrospinae bacterium]|nr:PAS domain S-box protein [Nitrospinota bacterium]
MNKQFQGLNFPKRIGRFALASAVAWTAIIIGLIMWDVSTIRSYTQEIALGEATASFQKDLIIRQWASIHGGVYVPETNDTPPNQYLDNIPERDISTPSGKRLTLMNPAYITRQLNDMYRKQKGIFGHLTSLKVINPNNAPDEWERQALLAFEQGKEEVHGLSDIEKKAYMRLMKPLFITEACLKCHARHGFKLGDIRGGISVSVPMDTHFAHQRNDIIRAILSMSGLWLLGVAGIGLGAKWLKHHASLRAKAEEELMRHKDSLEDQVKERTANLASVNEELVREVKERIAAEEKIKETSQFLEKLMDSATNAIFALDMEGRFRMANNAAASITGYPLNEIIGMDYLALAEPGSHRVLMDLFQKVSSEGIPVSHFEIEIIRKDGELRFLTISVAPMRHDGQIVGVVGTAEDITEIKRAEEALRQSENKYKTLVDTADDAIVLMDTSFKPIYFNKVYCSQLGLAADECDNFDPLAWTHPEDLPNLIQSQREIFNTGRTINEYRIRRKNGSWIVNSARSTLITGSNGKPTGILSIIRDVTDKKKAEDELRAAKENAEEATLLRDKFMSLVSHDLKSPLASLGGILNIVRKDITGSTNPKTLELMDAAIKSSGNMIALINDLLNVSRLKTGKITLQRRFFDAHFLAQGAMEEVRTAAESKGLRLVNQVPQGTRIHADLNLLMEVMRNLMANAVKFTSAGGTITAMVPESGGSVLAVKDTGVGIKPDMFQKLFRYEEKTSTLGTAGELGTGLGLPLCNDILMAHGGNLEVESQPGLGSTFAIHLPIERPRVLIVDGEPLSIYMLKEYLDGLELEIRDATDGLAAMETIAQWPPHLVIAELNIKGINGLSMLKKLKTNPSTHGIHVIVMTSLPDQDTKNEIFRLGADDFITKPLLLDDLIPRVRKITS